MRNKIIFGMICGLIAVLFMVHPYGWTADKATDKKPVENKAVKEGKMDAVKEGAGTLLDDFEANDWLPLNAEGTAIKTDLAPGKIGKALQIDYDLKNTNQWVQISKDIAVNHPEGKAIQFYLKSTGKQNTFEFKLVDGDGSNYGQKFMLNANNAWEMVTLDYADFAYWWGGDSKLDEIKQIFLAVSTLQGGKGTVAVDEMRLVPSTKKEITSGMIDNCDTLEGWNLSFDQGSNGKLVSVAGKDKQAIGIDYNMTKGHWVLIEKSVAMKLTPNSTIKFFFKWTGAKNNLEVKLIDKDGSVFGRKFDALEREGGWQSFKIPLSEFTYWWGGDKELDLNNIVRLGFAASMIEGNKGTFAIDQIELIP